MTLVLLLDQASLRFRYKHKQSNLEVPEIQRNHLSLESVLKDLIVCLGEDPVGGTSHGQSNTQIVGGKGTHL